MENQQSTPTLEQQPLQPSTSSSVAQVKLKKPSKLPIILMTVVTLLSLAISGYLAYQNYQLRQQLNQKENFTTTPTSELSETWETYVNDAGYSINYPNSFTTQVITEHSGTKEAISSSRNLYIYQKAESEPYLERYINLEIFQMKPSYIQGVIVNAVLGNKTAEKIEILNSEFDIYVVKLSNNKYLEIYVSSNPSKVKLANKILSTFKFTETKCSIYPRTNSNIPPSETTLIDKSEVRCEINGKESVWVEITDKAGFDTAKNSIYRFWEDNDGYKILIVDQNGAGSGEGNGKLLLLKNEDYEVLYCFHYVPEKFSGSYLDSLTNQEISYIKNSTMELSNQSCNNFVLENNIEL